jgi:hypothetical protein
MPEPNKPVISCQPTITSSALPPSQQPSAHPSLQPPVEKEISYQDIVAKPLRPPNFMNMKHKNPNVSLFWGNRAVGEKESGLRYDQLLAMGFVPVKPEEVLQVMEGRLLPCPPSIARDGRVLYGDLILLKIAKVDYIGSQKWNEQTARLRVKKPGVAIEGDTQAADSRLQPQSTLEALEHNKRLQGKIKSYVPNLAEVDAKTADNSGLMNLADPTAKPL